ncbi:MAG: transcription antitermination factor NusB [Elusimicrobiota bacterium]
MGKRREARKLAIRALYTADALDISEDEAWSIVNTSGKSRDITDFARVLLGGTMSNLNYIDDIILKHTKNWEMGRIAKVDRAIIRMGFYEIFFETTIPRNAAINEAVELAKYFSTEKSHKFVNGILDTGSKNVANDR